MNLLADIETTYAAMVAANAWAAKVATERHTALAQALKQKTMKNNVKFNWKRSKPLTEIRDLTIGELFVYADRNGDPAVAGSITCYGREYEGEPELCMRVSGGGERTCGAFLTVVLSGVRTGTLQRSKGDTYVLRVVTNTSVGLV